MIARTISFTVPGAAVPSRRRTHIIAGHVGSYQTRETAEYRNLVRLVASEAARSHGLAEPWRGAVELDWCVVRPVPASWSGKRRMAALADDICAVSRPDLDNLSKLIQDAMTGVIYRDDAQIVRAAQRKCFGTNPVLSVVVMLIDERGIKR